MELSSGQSVDSPELVVMCTNIETLIVIHVMNHYVNINMYNICMYIYIYRHVHVHLYVYT